MKNLYHVQDGDRPMYVIAESWQEAVDRWRSQLRVENEDDEGLHDEQPTGIHLVAEGHEDFPEVLP